MTSRIVNYEAYNAQERHDGLAVISVEVLHDLDAAPTESVVAAEVSRILPWVTIENCYKLPRSLRVPTPSLKNTKCLDAISLGMESQVPHEALFFAGMRTDKGVFFSHHTVGAAYEAALECARRFY